jgi:hypothetical protein
LNALQKLDLLECDNSKELFSSIGQLNAFQKLDISGCSNLKELPSSIGQLNALQKLDSNPCYNLKKKLSFETTSSIASEKHISKFTFH